MSRATMTPFLGPAAVLYLIAAVASLPGPFPFSAWVTAAVAFALSLTALVPQRHPDVTGALRVGWLGLSAAVALVTTLPRTADAFVAIEGARWVAWSALGYLSFDLALWVPEPSQSAGARRARWVAFGVAALGTLAAVFDAAPPLRVAGATLLLSADLARGPEAVAALGVCAAWLHRMLRARTGGRPEAVAENTWAQAGLVPSVAFVALTFAASRYGWLDTNSLWFRGALCLSAVTLVRSHVLVIDPRYRLALNNTLRRAIALSLSLAVTGGALIGLRALLPVDALDLALCLTAALMLSLGLYGVLTQVLRVWLAPARGALLDALNGATARLTDVASMADVGAAVLPALRSASLSNDGTALLYAFDPAVEVSIDAAGQARVCHALPPQALVQQVQSNPHEIIVRRPLEDMMVRRPEVRPLVDALTRLDALCVIPLRNQGELEGMLVLPHGDRHESLMLEELVALDRFGALLAAFVSVLSRETRAAARLTEVIVARDQAEQRNNTLVQEGERLQRHERALALGKLTHDTTAPIAYSPKMRALLDRLTQLAKVDVPVLLRLPSGSHVEALACHFHRQGDRSAQALVFLNCAALNPTQQRLAIFGSDLPDALQPGHLRLAQGGTLVLIDTPALSTEVQAELHQVVVRKRMRPVASELELPVDVRLLCTSRVDVAALVRAGRFDVDLADRLTPVTLVVPPLRERQEDLHSLALLAIDRAARVLGRHELGIEPDALAALVAHRLDDNETELSAIVERAAQRCDGARIQLAHLKLSRATTGATTAASPLSGTFDTVEKRVLKHALAEAQGNKSEAARMLGLKRTTFLDKLRRHGLDDGTPSRAAS